MNEETIIKRWKQGYSKNKIVEEYLEEYTREAYKRCGNKDKPSAKTLRHQAQQKVEETILKWWNKEVQENKE